MKITLTDLDGIAFEIDTLLISAITRLTGCTAITVDDEEIRVKETPEQISGKCLRRTDDEEFE